MLLICIIYVKDKQTASCGLCCFFLCLYEISPGLVPLCRVRQSRLALPSTHSNTRALEKLISCSSERAGFLCQMRSQVKTIIVGKSCLKILCSFDLHVIFIELLCPSLLNADCVTFHMWVNVLVCVFCEEKCTTTRHLYIHINACYVKGQAASPA